MTARKSGGDGYRAGTFVLPPAPGQLNGASSGAGDGHAPGRPVMPSAPRLVSPARRRRPLVWGLGLVLATAGASIAGVAALSAGDRSDVVAVVRAVGAGDTITAADLGPARVAKDPALRPVQMADIASVVGRQAAVDLVPGTLLSAAQVTDDSIPAAGSALVGVALKSGQLPARPLARGDRVLAVTLPDPAALPAGIDAGQAPADPSRAPLLATVVGITSVEAGGFVVDLQVPQDIATGLTVEASQGRVTLVLLPRSAGR